MKNFITKIIDKDLENKRVEYVNTRFPPEPNGHLHLGHAKSLCLNFGIAEKYNGLCLLRMDDTNPTKESTDYTNSIIEDVKWLGFEPSSITHASDYFYLIFSYAKLLIKEGKAYVCDLSPDEIKEYRGVLTDGVTPPGKNSPYRNRTPEENTRLFDEMCEGKYPNGAKCLRAKIDMNSPNLNMRDPVIYRILHEPHHLTKNTWCIYPTYDFAHPLCDMIEEITHSICTLEFEDHRPLYDWVIKNVAGEPPFRGYAPNQIEFARLNVRGITLSKRKLAKLVGNEVDGWDDPRMPTICGLRKRGYTPSSIKNFCEDVGVAKFNGLIEPVVLENSIRSELNANANRIMAVVNPLKVTITNYGDETEEILIENNPEDPNSGKRKVPFCKDIYIDRNDFMEDPPKKFFRLAPGKEVRLKRAYIIKCNEVVKDNDGNVIELRCTYDTNKDRKVKGTLHWVSAKHAKDAEINEFESIFNDDECTEINSNSKKTKTIKIEPIKFKIGERYQFFRVGYFIVDNNNPLRFNHIVSIKDTWSKIAKKAKATANS